MFLLIGILTLGVTSVFAQCPENFERHGSECYKVMLLRSNWIQALRYCRTVGGFLANIQSSDEQRSIEGLISRYHGGLDITKFWIGGGDMFSEGEFLWYIEEGHTEQITGYTDYGRNQPDNTNGKEHCLSIEFNGNTAPWNDKECTESKYFVCEAIISSPDPVIG